MEIQAQESSFERVRIPEGIHHAELVAISDAPDGQYGPRVALDFLVYYSKKEKPAKIGRVFGKKLTPKSKLWEAFEALGGRLKVGDNFDTNGLMGKPCRVMVEDYQDNDGKTVSGINRVKAADENTVDFIFNTKEVLKKTNTVEGPVPVENL